MFNNLNKEQLQAIHLPDTGTHLIIGGPGTGKSVVALWRVHEHHRKSTRCEYCFLVYNRLLYTAGNQLMDNMINSSTWISWFKKFFESIANRPVNMNQATIDWNDVKIWLDSQATLPKPKISYLIIDEGQDMPPVFYTTLVNMGIENFYVVADQNQQITAENSSRRELEDLLAIEPDKVIELKQNYRNTYPIARLARAFYTGDPASPPPDLPPPSGSVSTPQLIEYSDAGKFSMCNIVDSILKRSDNNPTKLIGILTPSNTIREKYFSFITDRSKNISLDHPPRIVTYNRVNSDECLFTEGGIFVLNAHACKGLEFDTVFIADIHEYYYSPSIEDSQKRLFYVMVARARDSVFMLKKEGCCRIDPILPKDPAILKRLSKENS